MMPVKNKYLDLADALHAAENMAEEQLRQFAQIGASSVLSNFYIAADGCWFFFANENIKLPRRDSGKLVFTAYAVSQAGQKALVYDFRSNMNQMMDYVAAWSLHARGKHEECKVAIEQFMKNYPASEKA